MCCILNKIFEVVGNPEYQSRIEIQRKIALIFQENGIDFFSGCLYLHTAYEIISRNIDQSKHRDESLENLAGRYYNTYFDCNLHETDKPDVKIIRELLSAFPKPCPA